jgi:hypothetical protein
MFFTRQSLFSLQIASLVATLVLQPHVQVRSEVVGPYQPDQYTLHLYHFDRDENPAEDSATKATKFSLKRAGGAEASNAALSGFGKSLSTQAKTSARACTSTPSSTNSFWNEQTHAFTYEALVRMDFDPNEIMIGRAERMNIFALDSNDLTFTRSFILSFRPIGVAGATTPSIVFVKYAGLDRGAIQTITMDLPLTGINAPVRGKWFHVAVSYSGTAGASGNLKFYWTRVEASATHAELLGTATLEKNPAKQKTSLFSVGNNARKKQGFVDNWEGEIDEIRISDVVRKDDEFLFRPDKRELQKVPKEKLGVSVLHSRK